MSRLGDKIKSIRTEKGMTKKQLGKAIGVSEGFVDEVEAGKKVLNDALLKRVIDALGHEIHDATIFNDNDAVNVNKPVKVDRKVEEKEVQKLWDDAFGSVLKTIPVFDYSLTKVLDKKQLPVLSNKVEGFAKDKVCYLQIQDDEMLGFKMSIGDIAFAHMTQDIENNTICLIEVEGQRKIRQIKRLDKERILLVSNKGSLVTETISAKSIKVLLRLLRLEIQL